MKFDRPLDKNAPTLDKPYIVAEKTLQAIEDAFQADDGNLYRHYLRELLPLQEDIYQQEVPGSHRPHLGGSMIGRKCKRELWYGFRWVYTKKHPGWLQRLFNRGHMEEPRMVALLLMVGCQVWQIDENGNQYRIKGYKGHYGGSLDGVVRGLPDMPDVPMLSEFKTYNLKQFTKLVAKGVKVAKPEHFVQMNEYMHYWSLPWAVYIATCKDNDQLHIELIQYDPKMVKPIADKVIAIVDAYAPPPKINESASWWECKFCDFKEVCHKGHPVNMNCRTCKYARVENDSIWACVHPANGGIVLTNEVQATGCGHYEVINEL